MSGEFSVGNSSMIKLKPLKITIEFIYTYIHNISITYTYTVSLDCIRAGFSLV